MEGLEQPQAALRILQRALQLSRAMEGNGEAFIDAAERCHVEHLTGGRDGFLVTGDGLYGLSG